MGLITQKLDYDIAGGDTTFPAVQLKDSTAAIHIQYTDMNSEDVEVRLEQSLDGQNFNELPGSQKLLDPTKPSHLFNLTLKKGIFIRVCIAVGSATAGVVNKINYLI